VSARQELSQILEGIFYDLDEGKLEDRESWLSMIIKKGRACSGTTIQRKK